MIVQMPAGVDNERLTNERLSDANADGWHAYAMLNHNGLLVFLLGRSHLGIEQKVMVSPPDEQFEQPINVRVTAEHEAGWLVRAMENHCGFLVFLMDRHTSPKDVVRGDQ